MAAGPRGAPQLLPLGCCWRGQRRESHEGVRGDRPHRRRPGHPGSLPGGGRRPHRLCGRRAARGLRPCPAGAPGRAGPLPCLRGHPRAPGLLCHVPRRPQRHGRPLQRSDPGHGGRLRPQEPLQAPHRLRCVALLGGGGPPPLPRRARRGLSRPAHHDGEVRRPRLRGELGAAHPRREEGSRPPRLPSRHRRDEPGGVLCGVRPRHRQPLHPRARLQHPGCHGLSGVQGHRHGALGVGRGFCRRPRHLARDLAGEERPLRLSGARVPAVHGRLRSQEARPATHRRLLRLRPGRVLRQP